LVKIITPTPLVAEAADVLAGFRDLVVVVGATAIEVALSGADVAITPTRDVDVIVPVAKAEVSVSGKRQVTRSGSGRFGRSPRWAATRRRPLLARWSSSGTW
jgi:hypothetical protein